MKIAPSYLLLSLLFSSAYSQKQDDKKEFTLTGHIRNYDGKTLYLSYRGYSTDRIWDSCTVKKNTFRFSGVIDEQYTNAFLTTLTADRMNNLQSPEISPRLFLDPLPMEIQLAPHDLQHAVLTGSKTQDDYDQLNRSEAPVQIEIDLLNNEKGMLEQELQAKGSTGAGLDELGKIQQKISALRIRMQPLQDKIKETDRNFIFSHPRSYVTAWLLNGYTNSFPVEELNDCYSKMPPVIQGCYYGRQISMAIAKLMKGAPGSKAPDFRSTEMSGSPIALSDYRGRYVLLDFWASWCGPCRRGNPALVELYKKYSNKGIEFIGIASVTDGKENWETAIKTDGLGIWKHIHDTFSPGYNNGDISEKYSIYSLPTQILVDPNGMVIGRYGDGGEAEEMMPKKLKMLFEK